MTTNAPEWWRPWDRPECTLAILNDPRVEQLPQGNVLITGYGAEMRIVHADPRVVIGAQLLEWIEHDPAEGVTLTLGKGRAREPAGPRWEGAVLRIEASNRTLLYRIGEWLPWYLGCIAEWPD